MPSGQTAARRGFECRNCEKRLSPAAYRAMCPNCGGQLRDISRV